MRSTMGRQMMKIEKIGVLGLGIIKIISVKLHLGVAPDAHS